MTNFERCWDEALKAQNRGDMAQAQFWATLAVAASVKEVANRPTRQRN